MDQATHGARRPAGVSATGASQGADGDPGAPRGASPGARRGARRTAKMQSLGETWPLHRPQLLALVLSGLAITAVFAAAGLLLTRTFRHSALLRYDQELAERMADNRTSGWNTVSWWGSMLAETAPKIVVTSIIAIVFVRVWKRWLEAVVVAIALILEASVFLAVTLIVGRDRPSVEQLDESPIGSSFPSGHTAAAVVYATIAVIVFWHTRNVLARVAVVALSTIVPLVVGWARMYRGMHHLTDTVAGAILGVVCLVVTVRVVRSSAEADDVLGPRTA